jgi:hypothetical protein
VRNLAIGFVLGVAVTIASFVAFGLLFMGNALIVKASALASATLDGPVLITIEVTNPHDDPVILDSVEVPVRLFQDLDIVAIRPSPSDDSPMDFFGSRVWFFEISLAPKETRTVELDVVAKHPGAYVAEFNVCNLYGDCSLTVVPLNFNE